MPLPWPAWLTFWKIYLSFTNPNPSRSVKGSMQARSPQFGHLQNNEDLHMHYLTGSVDFLKAAHNVAALCG